ncbi:Hypothetical_protein [Hexamita inflata]|uniref:Hypothetical_protein n=1 Tax=Hexamita inflata TaxID=28002 RepID=A0AA86RR64_9EUKA|nr:Hypothetical protein HINF_LOCUS717 [Hexamita inflata]CAI9917356.1 Hypothetical protein HINF_LOCUS5001 [Hexamita inflata]CAI9924126.1 Hypothetical protein HINF_LOCUS11771 [Hexamita inflata]CAI9924618.1 Hypothetical protein HINF_LOCUS12263 [Hexamita inflata]CAI9932067.1 Hypothetical protein HINF_LOCUS19712 [Hexamita inflata]
MPTMNESIYETHTQLFTPQFYNNIKTLTEVRKMQKYGGYSRLTKSEFDKYLMILFTMMISGKERGSVQDNWSKNTKIRNQFIADEVGMSCREWEEIHSNVCYGHIKLLLDQPEEEIDTNLDGIESDEKTLSCIYKSKCVMCRLQIMQQQICVFVQRISFVSRVLQNAYQ